MKLFLKGGSCIEVSDDYVCIINKKKIGFVLDEAKRESSLWSKDGFSSFEEFIIPREFVERVLI